MITNWLSNSQGREPFGEYDHQEKILDQEKYHVIPRLSGYNSISIHIIDQVETGDTSLYFESIVRFTMT